MPSVYKLQDAYRKKKMQLTFKCLYFTGKLATVGNFPVLVTKDMTLSCSGAD